MRLFSDNGKYELLVYGVIKQTASQYSSDRYLDKTFETLEEAKKYMTEEVRRERDDLNELLGKRGHRCYVKKMDDDEGYVIMADDTVHMYWIKWIFVE